MDSTETLNDTDISKKNEDEHCRLQRQFRTIQTDRHHRTMGVHPQFRRQDHLLRTLKKEYINILKDLKIAKSGAHKSSRERLEANLKKALLFRVKTQIDCEEGVIMMDQLDSVLHRTSKETLNLRKVVNYNRCEVEKRRQQSEYRLVSTENRLETAMLRFNAVQCENQKIRKEIDNMLKDRATFNKAWTKMVTTLNKGKKFLTDLFESSTLAYDQRDEWCAKLRSLQEKGRIDQTQQVQEMRDLQKAFDNEMKLYHFLARKGIMRINKAQERREEEQKRKADEEIKKQHDEHVKILDDIQEYTKESDIDKIIDSFVNTEHHNFSVYQLLTEYCAENVVLERDLRRIRQELEDRRDWNEMQESKRLSGIQKLKKELEDKQKIREALRSKAEEREEMLNKTMNKIEEMFRLLNCSLDPFEELLGDKQPSLHQLNLTLQLIADKIKEHLEMVYYYEHCRQKKKEHSSSSRLKKYTIHPTLPECWTAATAADLVLATPCPSCVESRWVSRVSEHTEVPFDKKMARQALAYLSSEPAYLRSDRVHQLTDCRVSQSRAILARRYLQY